MCNNVLLDIYVRSMLYAYCCTHQKSSITLVHGIVLRRCATKRCVSVRAIAVAWVLLPLLLLLLSTVMCACTALMISLVVVISRDFESQLKSSGHVVLLLYSLH